MKLLLLRHAKSDWDDARLDDHDRPLAPRGERAAALIGAHLAQRGLLPDLALCSSARRAIDTLERVVALLPERPEVRIERSLYLAEPRTLLRSIRVAGDAGEVGTLLVVGHNPGIGALAAALAGRGDARDLERMRAKFPTAALAELEPEVPDWGAVAPRCARLRTYCTPKDLV
ncbi:MAG: histidine phosphatase family protein [Myxococcota bacterium]|nr:histidine phosphatase family protein [Myxococcota bacterium]